MEAGLVEMYVECSALKGVDVERAVEAALQVSECGKGKKPCSIM